MSHVEFVQTGKYKFKITRNIQEFRGQTLIHTYKIGGAELSDCVNISYIYENNKPKRAKIPHLLYEPECAVGSSLERGGGTELMIKTLLRYAFNEVPTVNQFEFEDNSHIDCMDKNLTNAPPRKPKKPLNLAYFFIAYHGMTWYEARFNATMIDKTKYKLYKEKLKFLTDAKPAFELFLNIIGSALSSTEEAAYLEKLYNKTATYREFFEAIPKTKRCLVLYSWLNTFMEHYLSTSFSSSGWVINVNNMDKPAQIVGGSHGGLYKIFSYRAIHSL